MDEDGGGFCPDWVMLFRRFARIECIYDILFCREDVSFGIRWIGE